VQKVASRFEDKTLVRGVPVLTFLQFHNEQHLYLLLLPRKSLGICRKSQSDNPEGVSPHYQVIYCLHYKFSVYFFLSKSSQMVDSLLHCKRHAIKNDKRGNLPIT
jgi:hypothetical protein